MARIVVVGMQWGDEGKGKIVDLLGPAFDVVCRFQGGHNAGHTVRFEDRHFSLHLIPSGILRPGVECVLGNGMVIDPGAFFAEVEKLQGMGISVDGRLYVSDRAHVILGEQVDLDRQREAAAGKSRIGTTVRGIGPCYELKAARLGIRVADLAAPDLEPKLRSQMLRLEAELQALGGDVVGHPVRVADECRMWSERLKPYRANTARLLHERIRSGKSILFEGAQGTLLDLDHGTYPYVTSSNATAGGACTGTGVPPTALDGVLGVLKAYTTRVGGGPFLTEDEDGMGEYLRKRGNEFGTTTGRPRRCGWLDVVAARYAVELNGIRAIALTKLDVLDTLDEIPICVGYRYQGRVFRELPADLRGLAEAEPVYETLPGWKRDTVGTLSYDQLPDAARRYVERIEDLLETEIAMISTGPRREETIVRRDGVLAEFGI
jgi:adenylosuccinate synthase